MLTTGCLFLSFFVSFSFKSFKDDAETQSDKTCVTNEITTQPGPEQNNDSSEVKSQEHTDPCTGRHGSNSQEEMKTNNQQDQKNADIADQETNPKQ